MTPSPILNRYSADGGVPGPDAESAGSAAATTSIAWHYGDPLGEQRAATRGVIVVDRSDRAVLELTGPERLTWLNTISSQAVADLPDGASAENLSLDANGRVVEHFVLTDLADTTWIDTEAAHGAPLLDFLTKMVFWSKVTTGARTDRKVISLVGPDAIIGPVAELLGIDAQAPVYAAGALPDALAADGFWRRMPPIGALPEGADTPLPVVDIVVDDEHLLSLWDALVGAGARMGGSWAYDALRVAGLRARIDVDTDEKTIPHEARWIGGPEAMGAVHLDKGCYRGQETVARVHNLGKSPRRLVLLHLDGSADHRPATGDAVTAGGRTVGRVGTVVDHHEYGPIALALVKRAVGPDVTLLVGDESQVSARIDPDSAHDDVGVQAGREAVERLRRGPR